MGGNGQTEGAEGELIDLKGNTNKIGLKKKMKLSEDQD